MDMNKQQAPSSPPGSLPLCDIVMQGGVTSGVVYPTAAVELSHQFRLKNIGGTSVGALAAAVTAASELGRLYDPAVNPGYQRLAELTDELSAVDKSRPGVTRLFDLFRPQPGTRALFGILAAALNQKSGTARALRALLAALRHYGWAFGIVAVPLFLLQALLGHGGIWNWLLAVLLAVAAGIVAVLFALWRTAIGPFVANGFGLCTGYLDDGAATPPVRDRREPLTLWLSRMINQCAGAAADGDPLTFGELWEPRCEEQKRAPPEWLQCAGVVKWRYIDLQMISTNVTHSRPYRFPVEDEDQELFFHEDELRRWFPPRVVDWMVTHEGKYVPDAEKPPLPPKLHKLPRAEDLPVVFAARLSLSFPFLLSAVPLYAIDYQCQDYQRRRFERCWFSDGGICSNFPIHFFDAPLPLWPTFGLALEDERHYQPIDEPLVRTKVEKKQRIEPGDLSPNRFFLPEYDAAGRGDSFNLFADALRGSTRLLGFVSGLFKSGRFWQDHMLARAPAVRDRVVRIYLKSDEGGLNLNMPGPVLQTLAAAGARAANMLAARYCPGSQDRMNFDNHRWVRLRSLTRVVESDMSSIATAATATRTSNPSPIDDPGSDMSSIATAATATPDPGSGLIDDPESDTSSIATAAPPKPALDLGPIGGLIDTRGARTDRGSYGADPRQRARMHELLADLERLASTAQAGGEILRPNAPQRAPTLRIVPDI